MKYVFEYMFFIMLLVATPVLAQETVVVDYATTLGPVTHKASGLLHSLRATTPPDAVFLPLKIHMWRCHAGNSCKNAYTRVTALGSEVQAVLSDAWHAYSAPWPGDGGDYSTWVSMVTSVYNSSVTSGQSAILWDIWNEPDNSRFWQASQAQLFETWRQAYVTLRVLNSQAKIVGPSLMEYKTNWMHDFLAYAKTHNVLPDILSWHELVTNAGDVPGHVADARAFMAANGIADRPISINEYIPEGSLYFPGTAVKYFAAFERAATVQSAARACWLDTCESDSLDGLLTGDGSLQARSSWWAHKSYADITGTLVSVTAGATVDGVAGADASRASASLVFGRDGGNTENVTVQLTHLEMTPYLVNGGRVHVEAAHISNTDSGALTAPTVVINDDYPVVNNEVAVMLPGFGGNDAYAIVVTRAAGGGTPDTIPPLPPTNVRVPDTRGVE